MTVQRCRWGVFVLCLRKMYLEFGRFGVVFYGVREFRYVSYLDADAFIVGCG